MRSIREASAVAVVSVALTLGACSSQGDLIASSGHSGDQSDQSGTAQSGDRNLDADRVDQILGSTQEVLDAGDADLDADALTSRVADPALRLRAAQYAIAKAREGSVPPLDLTARSVTVTNSSTWPRAVVGISQGGDGSLPVVYALTQEDARSAYRLVNWTRMFGGTELTTLPENQGSPLVSGDTGGFVMTPDDAVRAYVDMLNAGEAGDDNFTSDEFASTYLQEVSDLDDSVSEAGSVTAEASAEDMAPPVGVVLQDDSALVASSFTYTHTYARTVADSTLKLGGLAAQLDEGDGSVTGTVTTEILVTVLLQIPPEESDAKASVVGIERAMESVTRDDSKRPEGE